MRPAFFIIAALLLFCISNKATAQEAAPDTGLCAKAERELEIITKNYPADALIRVEKQADCYLHLVSQGYTIIKYDMSGNLSGAYITWGMQGDIISIDRFTKQKKGSKIYIENVQAKGSDGKVVKLKGVTITL